MNIIDLATKTLQLAIQTAVAGVKTVVDAIKTVVDATKTKVDTVDSNVGTPATTANNATNSNAHAKLNWLTTNVGTLINGRVVKSVQRGKTYLSNGVPNVNVTISAINISKSTLDFSVKSDASSGSSYYMTTAVGGEIKNSTTLNFDRPSIGDSSTIYWEVVEYY